MEGDMRKTILAVLGAFLFVGGPSQARDWRAAEYQPRLKEIGITPEQAAYMDANDPKDQGRFVDAIDVARKAYKEADNEMAQGAARPRRAKALCSALKSPRFKNWYGQIHTLSSNTDGKGILSIRIGDNAYVRTWNNAFSDIGDDTLIDPDSHVFQKASEFKEGQWVRFSGTFIKSRTDCFLEASVTMDGSIQEPEFIARFTDIGPIDPGKAVAQAR